MDLFCTAQRSCKLLSILRGELGLSASLVSRLKYQNALFVNGIPAHTNHLIVPGDHISVRIQEQSPAFPPEEGPLQILYEDESLLALDKPPGLLIHPTFYQQTGTLANRVLAYYEKTGQPCAFHPVSRLDRDTFGVILLAKNSHIHALCCQLLQKRQLRKTYEALVFGQPIPGQGIWDIGIRREAPNSLIRVADPAGQSAQTRYAVKLTCGPSSVLTLSPITGRTHQLRVHCLHYGVPILGDPQYHTQESSALSQQLGLSYQMLCARNLVFPHPLDHKILELTSKQPLFLPEFEKNPFPPLSPCKKRCIIKIASIVGQDLQSMEVTNMFEKLIDSLKAKRRTIVFTEGPDARILEGATRLKKDDLMDIILVGNVDEVTAAAAKGNFDIQGMEILDPATYAGMDEMVAKMVELRKGKMSPEECRAALSKGNYFGTMLVKMGKADALLGGATYSTADTVRPALQLVKTKPGAHLVSSSIILYREGANGPEKLCMGDCAINIDYEDTVDKDGNVVVSAAQKLAEVAIESAKTAQFFGIDPKVAMLSYSTKGSGKGPTVDLVRNATAVAKEMAPELAIDGEMQFDAAVSPVVGQLKFPGSNVAGYANTFIFPNINGGNIGYKIAQRLGGFEAYGPILQGLNAPINDLSRGCNAEEVYKMAIITAGMA